MRYRVLSAMAVMCLLVGGCQLGAIVGKPTSYEKKVPAEFGISRSTQGRVAVLVQGAPGEALRRNIVEATLLELEKNAGVRKSRLVPAAEMERLRQNEEKYLAMTSSQIGAAVGAETVLVVKIANYGLYPLPIGGYHDCSMTASAMLVDVKSGTIMWPADGIGREVSLMLEAERGDSAGIGEKLAMLAAHGVVRYLYDCPKAYFRVAGEKRGSEWDSY